MSIFSSEKERMLWIAIIVILIGIYSTLGQIPLIIATIGESLVISVGRSLFLGLLILLVAIPIFFINRESSRIETAVKISIFGVYLLALIRIGSFEARTHLFEYGLIAGLIHEALLERQENGRSVPQPTILALLLSISLGWLDEGIQFFLPNRVYDFIDVVFNSMAALMIIGTRWFLIQLNRLSQRHHQN